MACTHFPDKFGFLVQPDALFFFLLSKFPFHNVCDLKGTPCQFFGSLFKILYKYTQNINVAVSFSQVFSLRKRNVTFPRLPRQVTEAETRYH